MKAFKVLAICLTVLPLIGTMSAPGAASRSRISTPQDPTLHTELQDRFKASVAVFRSGRYQEALESFNRLKEEAESAGFRDLVSRSISGIGGCEFLLHRYQNAMQSFLEARRIAEGSGDRSAAVLADANIASLYSEMGEVEAAAQWTQRILDGIAAKKPRDRDVHVEARMLVQLASLRARQKRMPEAEELFGRGLTAADRIGDVELYAMAWNRLGEEYLKTHELRDAEGPLLEAYRIRKLNHLPLDTSYRSLGVLRLEQGDLAAASVLLDRAVDLAARSGGPLPTWDVFHQRGRVRIAQGRLSEAMDDLRIAVRLAREWRWSAPPDDAARVGAEGWLEKVHSALVLAGNRLYLETYDPALIGETFEAAEENRASSLRALANNRGASAADLPAAYWEALGRLQRAEVEAIRHPQASAEDAVASARAGLTRMEAGLSRTLVPTPPQLLERTQLALDDNAALFSFHLGESDSWVWALDRQGLALERLPARDEIAAQCGAVAEAVRTDSPDAPALSARLYQTLFGKLDQRFLKKERWLLAPDGELFETPFGALLAGERYLAELHTIELIPGAGFWVEATGRTRKARNRFVGIGDPIYNTADPRFSAAARRGPGKRALLLPRLAGSGREVEACSRLWGGAHVILEGPSATRENLVRELAEDPAVVHLATHVLASGEPAAHGLIALSLNARRENQLLSPQEIAGWRTGAGLIVMSGCHSAEGATLPGTGLVGLTRAWLMAGARNVIASNWATPDESGAIFGALYRNLSAASGAGPAAALRAAQLEMIRSGGWRARARYWGAYFVIGSL